MKWILSLIFSTFIVQSTFAGGDSVGNGGHGHVCEKDGIRKVEVYDYFMLRLLNREPHLGQSPSYRGRVKFALDRLAAYDTQLANQLRRYFDDLGRDIQFLDINLPDTGDLFKRDIEDVYRQNGCKVHQLAIQFKENDPAKPIFIHKRYVIRKDLWEDMDVDQQAGLILHELIYRLVLDEVESSEPVQLFNLLISSNFLEENGLYSYLAKTIPGTKKKNPIEKIRAGLPFVVRGVSFWELPTRSNRYYRKMGIVTSGWVKFNNDYLPLKPGTLFAVGKRGQALSFTIIEKREFQVGRNRFRGGPRIVMHESGELASATLWGEVMPFYVGKSEIKATSEVRLYKNGEVRETCLAEKALLINTQGKEVSCKAGNISFDENGLVKSCRTDRGSCRLSRNYN